MRQQVSRVIRGTEYALEMFLYGLVVTVVSPFCAIRWCYCLFLCVYHYFREPLVSWKELEWFMFVDTDRTVFHTPDTRWVWNPFKAKNLTVIEKERYYRIKHTLEGALSRET